ncbi:dsDNA nuclease domain-containing protein [Sporosarcina sp. HYO08]|uniref:dsDNA nuclease domain-containing protein n=1 Tax=Sporosarcina sp. HYO08 TaxID=1759557 RepID=UPI0007994F45|nr:dsDNA nuclease domain-containing protein [Sporosarcina sp. HYO08]KXH87538.1 hypothetical protein AU377_02945 [Sporosarcina sp. HYO08]
MDNFKPRENSGSRSTNRLNLQASYAIIKILESHESDFTVVMDLVDDLAIFFNEGKNNINTYQIKTVGSKSSNYKLNSLISDDVFLKLYDHVEQFEKSINSINLITNMPISHTYKDPIENKNKTVIVSNTKIRLNQLQPEVRMKIEGNMKKSSHFIKHGLSDKFTFSLWDISVTSHYQITQAALLEFCSNEYPYMDSKTITALHKTLYEHLLNKQSYEFELTDDMEEVFKHKSYSSNSFKALLYQATSVGTLTMEKINSDYIHFDNLLHETKYNQALVRLKTKIFQHTNLFERNFEIIAPEIQKTLSKVKTKKELFEVLILQLNTELVYELSQIEKELLLINGIEEVLKRGLEDE